MYPTANVVNVDNVENPVVKKVEKIDKVDVEDYLVAAMISAGLTPQVTSAEHELELTATKFAAIPDSWN